MSPERTPAEAHLAEVEAEHAARCGSPHSLPEACRPKRSLTRSSARFVRSCASRLWVSCATKPTRPTPTWRFPPKQTHRSNCRCTGYPRKGIPSPPWSSAPGSPHASTITRRPPAGSSSADSARPGSGDRGYPRPGSRTGVGGAWCLLDAPASTLGYGGTSRGLRRADRKRDRERAGVVATRSLALEPVGARRTVTLAA